jgi:hypothetical protein
MGNVPKVTVADGGGNFEIGRKPISNPKAEILNWTRQSNLIFRLSDLRWAFVQFQNSLSGRLVTEVC